MLLEAYLDGMTSELHAALCARQARVGLSAFVADRADGHALVAALAA